MSIALVAHAIAASTDANTATTSAIDTTGATLLVMAVGNFSSAPTHSDSKGNIWVSAGSSGSNPLVTMWYVKNPTVGAGHTFTCSSTGNAPVIMVLAFSGTDTTADVDQTNSANGSGVTSLATGSVTPSANNEVVVTMMAHNDSTAPTIDSGFTLADGIRNSVSLSYGGGSAYLIQTTATAENPTWSVTNSTNITTVIATFQAAAAGGSTSTGMGLLTVGIGR